MKVKERIKSIKRMCQTGFENTEDGWSQLNYKDIMYQINKIEKELEINLENDK
jgi:hypothetical protein